MNKKKISSVICRLRKNSMHQFVGGYFSPSNKHKVLVVNYGESLSLSPKDARLFAKRILHYLEAVK